MILTQELEKHTQSIALYSVTLAVPGNLRNTKLCTQPAGVSNLLLAALLSGDSATVELFKGADFYRMPHLAQQQIPADTLGFTGTDDQWPEVSVMIAICFLEY